MRMLNLTVRGLVGAVLIVVGVAVSWQRTLIPAALDGTVRNLSLIHISEPTRLL